jgi:hydroxymethylbilane synthase
VRSDDKELQAVCAPLNHTDTARAVQAERAFLKHFGGGCHVPLGAFAYISGGEIRLSGAIASVDGKELLRQTVSGVDPDATGSELARLLKEQGAEKLL